MILAAVGMRREADILARPGVRVVCGGGRSERLAARLAEALPGATAIISFGLGGALDPALEVGDVVLAGEVLKRRGRWTTDAEWTARLRARLPGARIGAVHGADEMVLGALDKARLRRESGADLVDMESHVAAELAAARGLPFAVVRVVSDKAAVSLPGAVRAGLDEDGGTNLAGVLGALARDPRQLPALIRTGRDAGTAFRALQAVAESVPGLCFVD